MIRPDADAAYPAADAAYPAADAEFWTRFGDAIDDRIAETVAEILAEHDSRRRWPYLAGCAVLVLAALITSLLWRATAMAWVVWPLTTALCLGLAGLYRRRPVG